MKALILGGGFIGGAVATQLASRGIAARTLGSRELDLAAPAAAAALRRLIDADTAVFLAFRASTAGGPVAAFSRDMAMLGNVAEALCNTRARAAIFFSSLAIHGNAVSNPAVDEQTPIAPDSLYGASKAAGEMLLREATRTSGTPLLVIRPPMVYGPGDRSTAYGPARFLRSLAESGEIRLFGDGSERRPFVFIDDLARASVELLLAGHEGAFCVGPSGGHSFQDLVTHIRAAHSGDFRLRSVERDRPRTDQGLNPARLARSLPQFRFTPIAQGLETTYKRTLAARAEVTHAAS